MSLLSQLGLTKKENHKAGTIFEELVPDIMDLALGSPRNYIEHCWEFYQKKYKGSGVSTNGKYFELSIATLFKRENITPFYYQVQMTFIPNINYDFILYSKNDWPFSVSVKTSLRERYKQADLEAYALKNVHRKAKCSLITLDKEECDNLKNKIKNGDVLGLDECIYALGSEFNDFINRLKSESYYCPKPVNIIEKSYTCVK